MKQRRTVGKAAVIAALAFMTIGISFLHYRTAPLQIASHVVFRELYFLPILLAGFRFGLPGGVTAAFGVILFYLPYILARPEGITGYNLGNILQLTVFIGAGGLVGWLRDRERKQQQRLAAAENLAAMGKAVSCIAHDMKTPLIAIGGFVRQVHRKVGEEGAAKKLELVIEQVERLEAMVADMLAFARPLQLQCRQGAVAEILAEVLAVARHKALLHGVEIVSELRQDLPAIAYDPLRLQQALLNVVNNALEASPPGSEVVVRCGSGAGGVTIEVNDQGEGIPEERRQEIFTPFVTSKREGTGLGLPITKKIIEAHGGAIEVAANSEKGAVFRIFLPPAQPI